jgi:hypothetical protein
MEFGRIPFLFNLLLGFAVIMTLAFPFSLGPQIYAADPHFPLDLQDPECTVFGGLSISKGDGIFRLGYSLTSDHIIAQTNAWRMLRVFANGAYLHEELRASDVKGVFLDPDQPLSYFVFFEMVQEGDIDFDLKCLDTMMGNLTVHIDPFVNHSLFTQFHITGEISNICKSPQGNIVFARPIIKKTTALFDTAIGGRIENGQIDDFLTNHTEFHTVASVVLIDSFLLQSTFALISQALTLAVAARKADCRVLLNFDTRRWYGLDRIIQELANGQVAVVSHEASAFCWRDSRMPSLEAAVNVSEIRAALVGEMLPENVVFYNQPEEATMRPRNIERLHDIVEQKWQWQQGELGQMTLHEKIHALAQVTAMISSDDNNEVANAVWMPVGAVVILLANRTQGASEAVQWLEKGGRVVKVVPGIWEGGPGAGVAGPELEEEAEFIGDGRYDVDLEVFQRVVSKLPSRKV